MLTIAPGTLIDDRYRVVSRVGSGGMAEVYCAEDIQLGRRVAVKMLHERFAADEEFVERFRREASSAAALSHANIVSVYDRGEWAGTYYIAMEYLDGRSLDSIVREEAPLPAERAIEITEQVLRAARFAHRRGDRAPRPQAAQRDHRRGGPRQGHRLRDRARRARRRSPRPARSWAPRGTSRPSRRRASGRARAATSTRSG